MFRDVAVGDPIRISLDELSHVVERVQNQHLQDHDWPIVGEVISRYYDQQKRRWDKKLDALSKAGDSEGQPDPEGQPDAKKTEPSPKNPAPRQRKGHGKKALDDYSQATHYDYPLENFSNKQACDECSGGKLYQEREKRIIRIVGSPNFNAQIHHIHQARCRQCGKTLKAKYPAALDQHIGGFDYLACAILVVFHYLGGVPFLRFEKFQHWLGTRISDSTFWDIINQVDDLLQRVFRSYEKESIITATSLRFDDTGAYINSLKKLKSPERNGINASVFYVKCPAGNAILYYTGLHHAGEIMEKLLSLRPDNLPKLAVTTDAASKNFTYKGCDEKTINSVCNAHGYRRFKEDRDNHPEEYDYVKSVYQTVYEHDDYCKKHHLSPDARLAYHQEYSAPHMERLHNWITEKIKAGKFQLDSGLSDALGFFANQWQRLTEFLRTPGVPLDTNLVEQMVKIVILYRNNSRSYKNITGAEVGDRMMSLTQTVHHGGGSPISYLQWCLEHREQLILKPEDYTPLQYLQKFHPKQEKPPTG